MLKIIFLKINEFVFYYCNRYKIVMYIPFKTTFEFLNCFNSALGIKDFNLELILTVSFKFPLKLKQK